MLRIDPAAETDLPELLAFIRKLAVYEKLEHMVTATEEDLRRCLFGERPIAEALLARWDGQPAGFAVFFHNFSTFMGRPGLYLEDLFVEPELRGKGIGKALFARLAAIAEQRGCGRVEWSVLNWNTPSIEFYRGLGAVAMDEWTVYRLTGDALKRLAEHQA